MRTYTVSLNNGGELTLPIVDVDRGVAISLLMVNDSDLGVIDMIVGGLADLVGPLSPDVVIGIPEQGILLANGVARKLGHDRAWILRKTPKVFDSNAFTAAYHSVTKGEQRLYMPHDWAQELSGKKVVVVEDVVCTGGTLRGFLRLIEKANQYLTLTKRDKIKVNRLAVVLAETYQWEKNLGDSKHLVKSLGYIPMFGPADYVAIK